MNGDPIAPCGAVANSMFNGKQHLEPTESAVVSYFHLIGPLTHTFLPPDTFTLTYQKHTGSVFLPVRVPLIRTGLTWYTDKNVKYRNPRTDNLTLAQVFEGNDER